jgi:hypothetical protein
VKILGICFAFITSSSRFATLHAPSLVVGKGKGEAAGMAEDHKQGDRRALWDKIPRGLRTGLSIVGAVLAIVRAVLIIVVGLWAFVRPTDPTEKKDFLQAVGVLLAGLVGLGGLYFTWRNLNQTRQTTQRTLELTERGQITERFTRAIAQLGATDDEGKKRMEIRLGGIYALERIARDSEEEHWPIMEVLTAYVRRHARWLLEEGQEGTEDAAVERRPRRTQRGSLRLPKLLLSPQTSKRS